jgi:hypothetical protein
VTPAEEAAGVLPVIEAAEAAEANAEATSGADETAIRQHGVRQVPQSPARDAADPWQALMQAGAQLVSALAAAGDPAAPAHPWIERDPGSGAPSLKVPLPPPQTAGHIADLLARLANTLRGRGA